MAGITLAQAQAQLDRYLAAEYRIAIDRALEAAKPKRSESGVRKSTLGPETRADLTAIQQGITVWNQRVQQLSRSGSGRSRSAVPTPGW